jgi:hypothetical protein
MEFIKMFLNKEFLQLYEELSELNEAKADTERLINFAGVDLANRFLAVKNRLKAPENDLYYWIKNKSVVDLENTVSELENTKSATAIRKDAVKGGKLVCETAHWRAYHITTFEASQYYGRDTKWCITGINDYGDKYWNDYTSKGVKFYFLIAKKDYNFRGSNSKFAIALYPNGLLELYDQQDRRVTASSISYVNEISIPGVDFNNVCIPTAYIELCTSCACVVTDEYDTLNEPYETLTGERLCGDCLRAYIKEPGGLIELFMIIAYSNVSLVNLNPFIESLKLSQDDINKIVDAWNSAKVDGTLEERNLSQYETEDAEDYFIDNLLRLGFNTDTITFI